jgi:hypothetical protein
MPCFVMPLRTYEISKMMPIISEANQHQNKTNQKQIYFSSKCKSINCNFINCLDSTFQANEKIKKSTKGFERRKRSIISTNATLQAINLKLKETKQYGSQPCKEIYIGRYMDQCSDWQIRRIPS